ncbi:hypothetical protein SETIT_5G068500v2 [Setaria italica]|uniref:Uncharacterized protein n=1 Tax=Setaria italica TaxID=4555 RepID=A0A368R203_SETIT|nr:hypothetical protein SETIT_5G068500v2 [Setaria italica]
MRGAIPAAGDASAGEGHHLFVWRWRRSTTCPVRYLPPTRARRGRSCLRRWAAAASMKAPGAGVLVTGSEPTHLPSQRPGYYHHLVVPKGVFDIPYELWGAMASTPVRNLFRRVLFPWPRLAVCIMQ